MFCWIPNPFAAAPLILLFPLSVANRFDLDDLGKTGDDGLILLPGEAPSQKDEEDSFIHLEDVSG